MRRIGSTLLIAVMLSLTVLLGSCAKAEPDRPISEAPTTVKQAAFSAPSKSESGKDVTAFLVGEFTDADGNVARFNGVGDFTLSFPDGGSAAGSYSLWEYANNSSIVSMELDGSHSRYAFSRGAGNNGFTLTDLSGESCVYTPVVYN